MTESTNPFGTPGGVGVAEPEPAVEEAAPAAPRRTLFVVLGLAFALVVVGAAFFLLFSGGSEEVATGPVTQGKPSAAPSGQPAPPVSAPAVVPPTFSDNVGTDPFEPAVAAPPPAPADSPAPSSGASAPAGTTVVLGLTQVADNLTSVNVTVDGVAVNGLTVGKSFASSFKVYAIFNATCAGFLYGDESVALCEGDTATLTK